MDDEAPAGWESSLEDPVALALLARAEVWARIPWWWRRLRRLTLMHAIEVYTQAVLRAYHRGAIEGWPPNADGTPTVDATLQPRRRRAVRARTTGRPPRSGKREGPAGQ